MLIKWSILPPSTRFVWPRCKYLRHHSFQKRKLIDTFALGRTEDEKHNFHPFRISFDLNGLLPGNLPSYIRFDRKKLFVQWAEKNFLNKFQKICFASLHTQNAVNFSITVFLITQNHVKRVNRFITQTVGNNISEYF